MKKFLSLSLVVVLVLAMGAMAFAAEEGSLKDGATLEAQIPVTATIGPYASLWADREVQFGTLLGKVGLYTANGFDHDGEKDEFYHRVCELFFDENYDIFVEDGNNNNGWGSFHVESNTDVKVALSFSNTDWLASPTLFAVAKGGFPENPLAWASSNWDLGDLPTFFIHHYQVDEKLYGIDGAIYIESISQQPAALYTGTLTVTVSM